jgi:hypothetical protein
MPPAIQCNGSRCPYPMRDANVEGWEVASAVEPFPRQELGTLALEHDALVCLLGGCCIAGVARLTDEAGDDLLGFIEERPWFTLQGVSKWEGGFCQGLTSHPNAPIGTLARSNPAGNISSESL